HGDRQRRVQVHRRGAHLESYGPRLHGARRAHCHPPHEPRRRLRVRVGARVRPGARPRRVPHHRRRQDVEPRAVRGREYRLRRPGSGLWVTRDGGATWKRLTGHGLPAANHPVGKIAVAVAPSDPNRVYALLEDTDPSLYRSDDAGATWRLVSRNHDMAERAPYY